MDVTAAMLQSQARAGEASMHELVSRLVAELAFMRAELTGMRAEVGRVWEVMTEGRVAVVDMSAIVEGLSEDIGVRSAVYASKEVGGEGWGLQRKQKRALERERGRARENKKEGGDAEQNIGRGVDECANVAGFDSLADASCEAHDGRGSMKAAPERPLEGTVRNSDGEIKRRGADIKEVRGFLPVGGASFARCDDHAPRETEEVYPKRDEAREGNLERDSADCIKATMETGDRGIADMPVKLLKDSGVNKTGFEQSTRRGGERDRGREGAGREKRVKAAHGCVSMADKSAEWEDSNMRKLLVQPAQSDTDGKEKSQLRTSSGGESPRGTPQLLAVDKLRENVEDGKRPSEAMAPVFKDESMYETFDDDASTQPPPTVEPVIPLPCPSVQMPLRNHNASRELYSRNPGKASYGDNDSVACAQATDARAALRNAMVTDAGVEFKPTSSLNTPESSAVITSRLKKTRKRRKRRKIGFHELYTEPQEGEEYAAVRVLSGGGSSSADRYPSLSLSPSVPSPAKCGPIAHTGKVVHPAQNEAGSDALMTPASTHQCLVTTPVTDAKSSSALGSKEHTVRLLDRMLSPDATAKPTSMRPQPLPKHRSMYDIGIDGYTSTKSLIASVNALNAEKDRKLECKTKDIVRGRDRRALTAQACHECETFFRSEANSRPEDPGWYARMVQKACRHRFKTLPPATPPGYHDLTFAETETQPPKE